jgi:hypothetical protein
MIITKDKITKIKIDINKERGPDQMNIKNTKNTKIIITKNTNIITINKPQSP